MIDPFEENDTYRPRGGERVFDEKHTDKYAKDFVQRSGKTYYAYSSKQTSGRTAHKNFPTFLLDYAEMCGIDITKEPTEMCIKQAYHKACMQNHPDRGGSVEEMQRINAKMAEWRKQNLS